MTATVRFARAAERDILDATIWWRTNRTLNPWLFERELAKAIELLELFPNAGERARTRRFKQARVMVLPDTGHIIVYRCEGKARVLILRLYASRATPVRP